MSEIVLVCSTAPDRETAQEIAQKLVEERLAACVSIMPEVQSVYRWQGAVEEATEVSLMIKTTQSCFSALSTRLISLHPYDVPEVIALPVTDGFPAYMQWVRDETA